MSKILETLREKRAEKMRRIDKILALATLEDRDLTAQEAREVDSIGREIDTGLDPRIAELEETEQRRAAATTADQSKDRNTVRSVTGLREERTYRPDSEHSFVVDAFRARHMGDVDSQERVNRAQREASFERRDVGTGTVGGLVVPQYLVDAFAPVLRAGRATANAIQKVTMPPQGMSLVVPRGNTGATVAAQATQNTAVSNTDLDFNSDLTVNVRTFAGQQNVSRQALERGYPGIDQLVFGDLVADYAKKLDASIISDDGTSGTHKGLLNATGTNAVTYTQASPTAANFWPKLADANQRVAANRFAPADTVLMHPRRWGWLLSQVDSQSRPLFISGPGDAVNAMGTDAANFADGQIVGTIMGLTVIVDANIPTNLGAGTNEDRVFVLRRSDPLLWEEGSGLPKELRFEDVLGGNLTVKLVVYGYSAFTTERYAKAVSIISGTGLVTPTF